MNYLTYETPAFLEPFFAKFDSVFDRPEPQKYFRLYGTGLLLEIKRKNVQAIDSHIIDGNYQGLHHFISDSPWEEVLLNNQRISWLQSTRQTKSTSYGYLILDDTGNPKSGDATFATKKQYMGCLGKVDCGQVVVTNHYADDIKDWPVNLLPYVPQDIIPRENAQILKQNQELPLEKQSPLLTFRPKWELALELVDDALERKINFSRVLVDAWYGNCPCFTKKLEEKQIIYITSLYANRRVYYQLPCEVARNEHRLGEVVTLLEAECFSEVKYSTASGEVRTVYVLDIFLKIKGIGKHRVLIVKPTPDEVDMDKIEVLMTTDEKSEAAVLLRDWSFRDKIDKFYQHGKDDLGFDQYQVRNDRAIRRHWYMVFLMYSYLVAQRQQGSFTKWCASTCRTIGEMLSVIRLKLLVHWQRWCEKHSEQWDDFLQKKGLRVATSF